MHKFTYRWRTCKSSGVVCDEIQMKMSEMQHENSTNQLGALFPRTPLIFNDIHLKTQTFFYLFFGLKREKKHTINDVDIK